MTTKIDLYRGNDGLEASRALLYPIVYAMNPPQEDTGAATKGVITGAVKAGIGLTSAAVSLASNILGRNQEIDNDSPQEMSIRVNNYSNCSLLATLYASPHELSSGPVNTMHRVLQPFESCTLSLYSDAESIELPTGKAHRIRLEAEPYGLQMLNTETRWVDIEFLQLRDGGYQMGNSSFRPISVKAKNFNDVEVEASGLLFQEDYDNTEDCGSVAISVKTTDKPDGECQLVGFHSPNSIAASKNNEGGEGSIWANAPQCMTLDYCLVPTDIHTYNADGSTIVDVDDPEAPERIYPSWVNLSERPEETHTIIFAYSGDSRLDYRIDYQHDEDDNDTSYLYHGDYLILTVKKSGDDYSVYYNNKQVKYLDLNDGGNSDDLFFPDNDRYIEYDTGVASDSELDKRLMDLKEGKSFHEVNDDDGIDGDESNDTVWAWYVADNIALITVDDRIPDIGPDAKSKSSAELSEAIVKSYEEAKLKGLSKFKFKQTSK